MGVCASTGSVTKDFHEWGYQYVLDPVQLSSFISCFDSLKPKLGELVICEGKSSGLYFVSEGEVTIYKGLYKLLTKRRGDFFGGSSTISSNYVNQFDAKVETNRTHLYVCGKLYLIKHYHLHIRISFSLLYYYYYYYYFSLSLPLSLYRSPVFYKLCRPDLLILFLVNCFMTMLCVGSQRNKITSLFRILPED